MVKIPAIIEEMRYMLSAYLERIVSDIRGSLNKISLLKANVVYAGAAELKKHG